MASQITLLRARHEEEARTSLINHMDSIRFDPDDFARLAELWRQYEARADSSRFLRPPNDIPAVMEVLMNEMQDKIFVPEAPKPDWVASIVDHRGAFAGAGFYADSTRPSGDVVYKLLLSIAQPRRVVFLECHRNLLGLSAMTAYGCYEFEALCFVDHTLAPWRDASDIWVLPEVRVHGSEVHTIGEECPWIIFTRHLRKPSLSGSAQGGGHSGS